MGKIANPYIGPRTFEENERNRFFGREREARELLALTLSGQLVLFYAQSGAGKSSLVNTCLIPDLKRKKYKILPVARVGGDAPADLKVDNIYIFNLLRKLTTAEGDLALLAKSSLCEFLAISKNDSQVEQVAPNSTFESEHRVLIIDQFEELFSTHQEEWEKRRNFFAQLAQAIQEDAFLSVVLIMREDFVAALEPYEALLPNRLRLRYYMQRLGREAALKAVRSPAEKIRPYANGVAEKLVDDLCSIKVKKPDGTLDIQPGQYVEPVQLQVVCFNLWENLDWDNIASGEGEITEQDLRDVGDVNTSLGNYYARRVEEVAKSNDVSERKIRKWIEEKLIAPGGIRNLVLQEKNSAGSGFDNSVIEALQSDLVRAETRGGAAFYELTHDRLVDPIIENNKKWMEKHSSLLQKRAAVWWNDPQRNESWLSTDQALDKMENWAKSHADELTDVEHQYLDACRAKQQQLDEERANQQLTLQRQKEEEERRIQQEHEDQEREFQRQKAEQEQILHQQELQAAQALAAEQARSASKARRLVLIALSFAALAIVASLFAVSGTIKATKSASDAEIQQAIAQFQKEIADQANLTAQASKILALEQKNIARSYRFSTDANKKLEEDSDPALSMLLSVEAFQADRNQQSMSVLIEELQKYSGYRGFLYPKLPPEEVQFNPDGTRIVTLDKNGLTFWDPSAFKALTDKPINGHYAPVYSVALSPDGTILASGGSDGSIILRDTKTYLPIGQPLTEHQKGVWSIVFSPDGKIMASGSMDNFIILWDVETWKPIGKLLGHTEGIVSMAFSPDGTMLASASNDRTIIIWDVAKQQKIDTLNEHTGGVWAIAFSPDGKMLASGSNDDTIILWDTENFKPIGKRLTGHTASVRCLAFSPDSKMLASGSYDNTVILWDLSKKEITKTEFKEFSHALFSVAFSPTKPVLAASDFNGGVTLFDTTSNTKLRTLPRQNLAVYSIAFNSNGKTLISGSKDGSVVVWDISDINKPKRLTDPLRGHVGKPTGFHFSSNGKVLFSEGDDGTVVYLPDSKVATDSLDYKVITEDERILAYETDNGNGTSAVALMSLLTGQKLDEFSGEYQYLTPDGKILVTSSIDDKTEESVLSVWTVSPKKAIAASIPGSFEAVSQDGSILIARVHNEETDTFVLAIWNTSTGQQIGDIIKDSFLSLSEDGKTLFTADYDKNLITLWNTDTGNQVGDAISGFYSSLSKDNKVLVTEEYEKNLIGLWNTESGQQIGDFIPGSAPIVTSNNTLISMNYGEETVGLWNLSTGQQIGDFIKGSYEATSPDGTVLVVSYTDDEIDERLIGLWKTDTDAATQIGIIKGSFDKISSNGKVLLTSDDNGNYTPWDMSTGLQMGKPIRGSYQALSPNGAWLLQTSGNGAVSIQDVASWSLGSRIKDSSSNTTSAAISPDGRLIASYAGKGIVLQKASGEQIGTFPVLSGRTIRSLSFSNDNKLLAACDSTTQTTLWTLETKKSVNLPGCQPVFNPDGKYLALSDPQKRTTSLLDLSSTKIATVETFDGLRASFSADGKRLLLVKLIATTGSAFEGLTGNAGTPTPFPTVIPAPASIVTTIPTSEPEELFEGNTLVIWDISQSPFKNIREEEIRCPDSGSGSDKCVVSAQFSPANSNTIVYSNGSQIFFWDYQEDLPETADMTARTDVKALYFIYHGPYRYLVSENQKGVSTIWDIDPNALLSIGESIEGRFLFNSSHPEVDTLLYLDSRGNLVLWNINTEAWMDQLCQAAGRNFYTDTEWQKYFDKDEYHRTCDQWPEAKQNVD